MCLPLSGAISITCIWHSHTGMMYMMVTLYNNRQKQVNYKFMESNPISVKLKPTSNVSSDSFCRMLLITTSRYACRGGYRIISRGGTVNKSYKKVGVGLQKGVGAGGSRAKRGSF